MFQIIWTCSTIFNSINAKRIEFTIKLQRESHNSKNTLDPITKGKNVSLDVIKQNKLTDSITHDALDRPSSINNRLMPKMAIKHKSNVSYPKNSSYAPTTRRPLMKIMKFTTKPHVIHYIHSRFQDEQSTISIPKSSNKKIQFKPRNNKANQNITEDTDSVDDKFKTFIDIGDTDKQRDNFFATAASEKVGSVTNHSKFNTDEFRSYSKRAFEESLENIRNIWSRKNTTIHSSQKNTEPAPTQIKNNIIYIVVPSTIKNPAEILTASEQLALVTKLTKELPINPAQLTGNVVNVVNLQETSNTYVNTTEKSHFTKEDKSLATRIEQADFPAIRDTDDNAPTSQELTVNKPEKNIIGIQITTEKNNEYQAQSDKLEDFEIVTNSSFTTQQPDDQTKAPVNVMLNVSVVTTENTAVFTNTKENIDNLKNMNKVVGTENTTENINNSLINLETSVNFVTDTEKSDDPVVKTDAPVNHNNVVQIEKENTNFPTPKNTNDFATNSETFAVTGTKTEDTNRSLINAETTIRTTTVTTITLTQPSDGSVVTTEKLVNYANTLETTTLSTSTKENIIDFATKSKNFAVFKTTTENIQNSLKNTYTSNYSVATTEKILSSDVETKTLVTHPDDVNIANYSSYKTENLGAPETRTINTEKFSHLVTNKPDTSTHKSKKTLYHAEIVSTWPFRTADIIAAVETSGKTVLNTEKTVPLVVIVAVNSISLPELNEANGNIVDPDISTIKDEEKAIKEDKFSESPISVEDEASITMAHHLALRRKR